MHVVVAGGGVAGLATALLLARDDHRVILIERDALDVGERPDAPDWERGGIPHFLQPHAFIPRGRHELRTHLPDVYEALLGAGARDVDLRRKLPGAIRPDDEVLQYVGVRRPLIEWALRRAVAAEPGIDVRDRATVTGVRVDRGHDGDGRLTGIAVDGTVVDADLLVDALGRRTPCPAWLADAGVPAGGIESTDCGVVYFSRYYQLHDGCELPDGPWLLTPRLDLGYLAAATFPGDNGTFGAVFAVPTGVPEWRALGREAVYEAAMAAIPMMRQWVDPDLVHPITDVLPMAGLRNSLRADAPTALVGYVPVGDALCHTDPVLAHGLSFSLIEAVALAAALREHGHDLRGAADRYGGEVLPALRERFELASALDEQRLRMWRGDAVDLSPDGDRALFSMAAGAAVALVDPDVFRTFVRRIGLLDSTAVLDRDRPMQDRIHARFLELQAAPRPAPGPTRDEMAALVHRVSAGAGAAAGD